MWVINNVKDMLKLIFNSSSCTKTLWKEQGCGVHDTRIPRVMAVVAPDSVCRWRQWSVFCLTPRRGGRGAMFHCLKNWAFAVRAFICHEWAEIMLLEDWCRAAFWLWGTQFFLSLWTHAPLGLPRSKIGLILKRKRGKCKMLKSTWLNSSFITSSRFGLFSSKFKLS